MLLMCLISGSILGCQNNLKPNCSTGFPKEDKVLQAKVTLSQILFPSFRKLLQATKLENLGFIKNSGQNPVGDRPDKINNPALNRTL